MLMARRTRWARRRSGPPRSGGGRPGGGGIRTGGNGGNGGGGGHVGGDGVGAPEPEYSRAQLIVGLLIFPMAMLLIGFLTLLLSVAFNVGSPAVHP